MTDLIEHAERLAYEAPPSTEVSIVIRQLVEEVKRLRAEVETQVWNFKAQLSETESAVAHQNLLRAKGERLVGVLQVMVGQTTIDRRWPATTQRALEALADWQAEEPVDGRETT